MLVRASNLMEQEKQITNVSEKKKVCVCCRFCLDYRRLKAGDEGRKQNSEGSYSLGIPLQHKHTYTEAAAVV